MSAQRSWFRIHLSTAIVLMFVAGGLIWANLQPKIEIDEIELFARKLKTEYSLRGWPFTCSIEQTHVKMPDDVVITDRYSRTEGQWLPILLDLVIALSILICSAMLSERIIRRRENRVAPPPPTSNK